MQINLQNYTSIVVLLLEIHFPKFQLVHLKSNLSDSKILTGVETMQNLLIYLNIMERSFFFKISSIFKKVKYLFKWNSNELKFVDFSSKQLRSHFINKIAFQ